MLILASNIIACKYRLDTVNPNEDDNVVYTVEYKDLPDWLKNKASATEVNHITVTKIPKKAFEADYEECPLSKIINKGGKKVYLNPQMEDNSTLTELGSTSFAYNDNLVGIELSHFTKLQIIGESTFEHCKNLKNIKLPVSLISIEVGAFAYIDIIEIDLSHCTQLKTIREWAFGSCQNLKDIKFPASLSELEEGVFSFIANDNEHSAFTSLDFSQCTELTEFPDGLFSNADSLREIKLPPNLETIESRVFENCKALEMISLPKSIEHIRWPVFTGCSNLKNILVSSENTKYSSINGILFNKSQSDLIIYPAGKTESSYTMPDGVYHIKSESFDGNTHLKSITLSKDLDLDNRELHFEGCDNLTSIHANNNLFHLSSEEGVLFNKDKTRLIAFPPAKNGSYSIPNGIEEIATYAFSGASNLTQVSIPTSLREIGNRAFKNCTSLEKIDLRAVTTTKFKIEGDAFSGSTNATIILPNCKLSINRAFPFGKEAKDGNAETWVKEVQIPAGNAEIRQKVEKVKYPTNRIKEY